MKKILSLIACAIATVACADRSADISGRWSIETACGMSTEGADTPAFISFEDGRVNGNASVNSFFGEYSRRNDRLTISRVGMTRMMGGSMEIEQAVIDAVNSIASLKVEGDKATAYNAEGEAVMTLAR